MTTSNKRQAETASKPRQCFIFIGPPGAGKGTVANKLSEGEKEKGYVHISTGELLRMERETNQFIKDNWSYTMLEDIAFQLLEKAIQQSESDVILDGCPKTVADAEKLEGILAKTQVNISVAINFQLDNDEVLRRRISGRVTHPSGRGYHEQYNPPKESNKDDVTGETLTKRHDDSDEIVLRRISRSRTNLDEVADYYASRKLLRTINAELDPPAVLAEVQKIMANPGAREEGIEGEGKKEGPSSPSNSTARISEFVSRACTQLPEKEAEGVIDTLLRLAQAKLRRFPGAHPTALTRDNMGEAFSDQYHVAIKSDGIRYLVLIRNSQVFLVNRKMEVFRCNGKLGTRCTDTLLDAEVVQELPTPASPSAPQPTTPPPPSFSLLVFDALCVNGRNVRFKDIQQRMRAVRDCVLCDSRARWTLPFAHIECKQYYPVSQIASVLDLVPKANHNTDGLIFVGTPYKLGYDTKLFKWKPSAFNTADFLLRIADPTSTHFELYCISFADKEVPEQQPSNPSPNPNPTNPNSSNPNSTDFNPSNPNPNLNSDNSNSANPHPTSKQGTLT
eukprot:Phypoly_transcript_06334.p1 GENE.Phypoly_transcript_06334~~Phypoly_transcript_06334.p1  ORF type:complete len:581 (+),score=136.22 Phypoly_transcript_06334:58-1743(+)